MLIDVLEFNDAAARAVGVTIYPFGTEHRHDARAPRQHRDACRRSGSSSTAPAPSADYALTSATRATTSASGLFVADRSPGWGLGSHAFVVGGIGRITSDLGDGSRYFAEGGGGLTVGPFGVELSVKFAWNQLDEPVEHQFLTVPITLRGTLSF